MRRSLLRRVAMLLSEAVENEDWIWHEDMNSRFILEIKSKESLIPLSSAQCCIIEDTWSCLKPCMHEKTQVLATTSTSHIAVFTCWLGLGTKTTWLGRGRQPGLAWNTSFGFHKAIWIPTYKWRKCSLPTSSLYPPHVMFWTNISTVHRLWHVRADKSVVGRNVNYLHFIPAAGQDHLLALLSCAHTVWMFRFTFSYTNLHISMDDILIVRVHDRGQSIKCSLFGTVSGHFGWGTAQRRYTDQRQQPVNSFVITYFKQHSDTAFIPFLNL